MDQWLRETVSELEEARRIIGAVVSELRGEPEDRHLADVWRAYLAVEKAVALVKVELEAESPGRVVSLKSFTVPDERQALGFASGQLARALVELKLGNLGLALKPLREARNYLRALLRAKRLASVRKARATREG